jgi:hypothetical protein
MKTGIRQKYIVVLPTLKGVAYCMQSINFDEAVLGIELGEMLEAYLENKVFASAIVSMLAPQKGDVKGFNDFLERYEKGLAAEKAAVENL